MNARTRGDIAQDTFDRLRDLPVYVGQKIEHKFRKIMHSGEYNWYCRVVEVREKDNALDVRVIGETGYSHAESWDMDITVNGLADGEYIDITEEEK